MTNRKLLRAKIAERGILLKHLADKCGISAQAMSTKMKGRSEFTLAEAAVLRSELSLDDGDFLTIFFSHDVA